MIRIAVVEPTDRIGGAEISVMELAQHINPMTFEIEFLLPSSGKLSNILQRRNLVYRTLGQPRFASVRFQFSNQISVLNPAAILYDLVVTQRYATAVARTALRAKYDIIQGNGVFGNLVAVLAARWANLPCIWHVQDIVSASWGKGWGRRYLAYMSRSVQRVVAISQAVAESLSGIEPSKVQIIYHGVDEKRFAPRTPSTLRNELGLESDTFLVGALARLVPWKGHKILLEAAAQILEKRANVHFIVVGDSIFGETTYKQHLIDYARQLKIDKQVSFLGWREDTVNVLAGIDVLAHPALKPEPFGIALIEAMAMAKPIIASNLGGPAEIVVPGTTGYLFPANDSCALAQAILRLSLQPQLAMEMGQCARRRVIETFTISRNVDRFESLYPTLVGTM